MATIDRLEIQIEAQASNANKQLDLLNGKLTKLSQSLTSINSSGLSTLAGSVQKFASAASQLGNVKTADFTRTVKNIEKISSLNTSQIYQSASSMTMLSKSLNNMGNVSKSSAQVAQVAKDLSKLGGANIQKAITNLPQLAVAMNNLMATLSKAPQVSKNVIQMTNSLANLASQGSKVGTATSSINKNILSYSNSAKKATKSTTSLAASIGKFYASAFLAIRGVKALGKAIKSSMDFLETVNYFEVAMRQIGETAASGWKEAGYNSAEAYAESFSTRAKQLTEKMTGYAIDKGGNAAFTGKKSLGLDPSKVMQNQAVFAQISSSIGVAEESAMNFSKALTMLGADWASLRNITFDQSWEKFASALAGQSRAVRSLGIDITMATLQEVAYANGVRTAVSEMNQATKAQLRLLAIMKQSEVAFGDLANTISSPANQIRLLQQNFANLARTIGNLFLPILSKILPVVNGIVIALQRLFAWIGGLLGIKFDSINSSMGGMSDSMSDLVGGTDDYEDSLEDANKAAKKLKSTVLGIDELNINAPDADSGGANKPSGSVGGGMPELDLKIADALAEYEKVWNDAFDRMENKAQEFADKIEKAFRKIWEVAEPTRIAIKKLWDEGLSELGNFTWNTLGDFHRQFLVPVGKWMFGNDAGLPRLFNILNDMLTDIDWGKLRNSLYDLYGNLSDLTIFAFDGLFDFFDYFLAPLGTWAIGSALPQLADILSRFIEDVNWEKINAALERFWKALLPFAQAVGQGIINFYSDLMKVGAGFINAIVPGGINLLAAALEKIDPRTVERIAYALSALVTAYIGFKAISKVKGIVTGAFAVLYSSTVLSGLKNVTTKMMGFADTIPIVTSALKGNKGAADALAAFYPKLNKSIVGVSDAFGGFKANLQSGAFFKNTLTDLRSFGEGLSGIQKGAIGAVAVFAQFNVISNAFEDLVLGTENFVAGIGKIAIAAGLASVALYTAFGPVGLVVAAITGVVAAIVGIDKAMDKIKENSAMESVGNALKNPGGTPLEEITAGYQTAIGEIGKSFDSINEKSAELETTKGNVKQTTDSIDLIAFAMENGSKIVGEKIPELTEMFSQLVVDSKSLFEQEYDTIMIGLSGALGDAVISAGYSLEEFVGIMDSVKTGHQKAIDDIMADNKILETNLSEGKITQDEYASSILENWNKISDVTKKTDEYANAISGVSESAKGIDFSNFLDDDLSLNSTKLTEDFTKIGNAANDARDKISSGSESLSGSLQSYLDEAERIGNVEGVNAFSTAIEEDAKGLEKANGEVAKQVLEYGNLIQKGLLEDIPTVIDNALAGYEKQDFLYRKFTTETEHVQAALDTYQTDVLDKATSELETMYSSFGIEGAGWASEAGKEMIAGLYDVETYDLGASFRFKLKNDYQGEVTGALGAAQTEIEKQSKAVGTAMSDGTVEGIKPEDIVTAIKKAMEAGITTAETTNDSHSPSLVYKALGKDVVDGFNLGITDNAKSTETAINTWLSSITELFNPEKWNEMYGNVFLGFQTKWNEFTAWWSESAMPLWFEEGVTPWFSAEKWMETTDGMKLGITNKWTEFTVLWKTNFTKWWTTDIEPWFSMAKWNLFGENMKNGLFKGFEGITSSVSGILNKLIKAFESAMNQIVGAVNDFVSNYNSMSEVLGTDKLSKFNKFSFENIPKFADGGIVNRPTLAMIGEAGSEAVIPLRNNTEWIDEVAGRFAKSNYNASEEAVREQNALLREQNELLTIIANKEMVAVMDTRETLSALKEQERRQGFPFT